MNNLTLTKHARERFSQRSIKEQDLELAMILASEIGDGFMVLDRDYRALETEIKKILKRAKKLVGKRFVVSGGTIITAYHSGKRNTKLLLQKSKQGGMI